MIQLSERLLNTKEYVFARLAKHVKQLEKQSGRKVLNLGIGSPDVSPSTKYLEKLQEFLTEKDAHMYPGYQANATFSEGIITWYQKRFGVKLSEDELLPLLGAKDGISHIPFAISNPGDEILIPNPGYPGFTGGVALAGAHPKYYPITNFSEHLSLVDNIVKYVSPKTKAIWINFPSNPTGTVITKTQLEEIVLFAKQKNIILLYDNAYAEITFDGYIAPSILQIAGAKDIAIEIGSFSKSHSFAGYRMGWVVGNSEVIKAITTIKSQVDSGMTTPLQNLGGYALQHEDLQWKQNMLESYQTRRDRIAEKLQNLGLQFSLPKAGLYIWAKIPDDEKSSEIYTEKLLNKYHVLVAPGSAFGEEGNRYIRVSICANITDIDSYL